MMTIARGSSFALKRRWREQGRKITISVFIIFLKSQGKGKKVKCKPYLFSPITRGHPMCSNNRNIIV